MTEQAAALDKLAGLVREHHRMLVAYAGRWTRNYYDAEDAVQAAYETAMVKMAAVAPRVPLAWLRRVVRNHAIYGTRSTCNEAFGRAGRSGALSSVAGLSRTEAWTRTAWAFLPRLWLSPPLQSAASRCPGRTPRAASPGRGSCFRGWFWEPGGSLQTTITSSVR